MSSMDIRTAASWVSTPGAGFDAVSLQPARALPALGKTCCLIRIHAVSLNHRDIAIPLGTYPMASADAIVPCSDASATVVAVGAEVSRFAVGDQVCTIFNPTHQSGSFRPDTRQYSLGSGVDGVLRKHAIFDETALVAMPSHMSPLEASTLSCAAVTVWNAFFGMAGSSLKRGDFVLTQGTGGVSVFGIQIALAVGATVIATTSSREKMERLKSMGVQHVINYRTDRDWGDTARGLTPGGAGVDHVLDVGGDVSLVQSLKAVRMGGVVSVVGFLDGDKDAPGVTAKSLLTSLAIVRGLSVGPRDHFEAMNAFLVAHDIHPIVDSQVFPFDAVPAAFRYYEKQGQWGKVVIQVD